MSMSIIFLNTNTCACWCVISQTGQEDTVKIKRVNGTEELPQQYLCLTQLTLLHLVLASFLASLAPSYSMYAHISIYILLSSTCIPSDSNLLAISLSHSYLTCTLHKIFPNQQQVVLHRISSSIFICILDVGNLWNDSFNSCSPIQLVITIQW